MYIALLAGFLLTLIAMGFFLFWVFVGFFFGGVVWLWFVFLNLNIEFVCLVTFPVLQLEIKQEDSTL